MGIHNDVVWYRGRVSLIEILYGGAGRPPLGPPLDVGTHGGAGPPSSTGQPRRGGGAQPVTEGGRPVKEGGPGGAVPLVKRFLKKQAAIDVDLRSRPEGRMVCNELVRMLSISVSMGVL